MGRVAAVLRESNPFADFVRAFAPMAGQAIDKRNETEAWNQFSNTFVPSQPMDVQQVQAPVSELPGQSGIGTQPSAPVQQPIQTQTEQVNMPSKDPYKQLEYETGKEFATKLKALSGLNPQERQFAMRQLYQEREQLLSNARYDKFSQDMEGIMAEYNPADPVAAHKAKAKAIALGRRLKIDTGDVLKLFEEPKQNLQFAPDGTMFVNGRQASNQGQYRAPEKPTGQLTEYQRYQIQKDKENPVDKVQNIPGFGNITNAQILSLYTSSQPKETQREVFNPITGQKEMVKSVDPGKPETIALLKPYVDKIMGVVNQQPATGVTNEPPIDEVIASVKANGEEQTLKLLTEAFGAKKAEELLGRSRAYSK